MTKNKKLESTQRLMAALVRMKPKPHKQMKVGKREVGEKKRKNPKQDERPKRV
jgi:hypothetical protein